MLRYLPHWLHKTELDPTFREKLKLYHHIWETSLYTITTEFHTDFSATNKEVLGLIIKATIYLYVFVQLK